MYNNNYYNKSNQLFAKKLKQNMTKSEACLWKYALKAGKMKGYSFRRQRPVLGFIADFICLKLKLIIEVDGYSHMLNDVIDRDVRKDKALMNAGFYLMRFTDDQVLTDMSNVIKEIEMKIEVIEREL